MALPLLAHPHALRVLIGLSLSGVALGASENFDDFAERIAAGWVRGNPQAATMHQYLPATEQDALDRELVAFDAFTLLPIEPAARERRVAQARGILTQLAAFDRQRLTPTQRISVGVIESSLTRIVETAPFADHWFVFQQMRGLHVSLVNFLSQTHPVRNRRDVENYLARLQRVAPLLDEAISEARRQAEHGIIAPRFILTAVIGQLDRFLEGEPAKNVLVGSLVERMDKLKDLPAAERARSAREAERLVRDAIRPAFERIRTLVAAQLPRASDDAGMWRLPHGAEAYAVALRNNTTTKLTPEEIHALGLREVARIEAEMDKLFGQLGYNAGTIKSRFEQLNAKLQPPAQPDPRPALIADYTRIVHDAERRAETLFDLRPKAPIEVRLEPAFTAKTAAAHYSNPAPDGTRPGIFWAPLPEILSDKIWVGPGMRSVTYHEAVPGHHFQIALQQELQEIPRFRQLRALGGVVAFAEGWALYAEKLAAEAGWYDGDLNGRIGQLNSELFRARRLVVDTGLHAKRWTRQQAIDYGIDVTEVERYVVYPGQACAYKVGELEILKQREKARRALGAKFTMKGFHNAVLRTGEVPLTVLGEAIDYYIAAAR